MLSNLVKLEHIVDGKVCQFICNHDTDLKIAKEALCKFISYMQQIEDQVKTQKDAQAASEAGKIPQSDVPDADIAPKE